MDVTTPRMTPRLALSVIPSPTGVNLNGGVLRMFSSWRRWPRATTPNRWLSVSRPVGPRSILRKDLPSERWDLPPPRAQENVGEKAHPGPQTTAEMGRSTDADGERECAETSPPPSLHRRLDNACFIDGSGFDDGQGDAGPHVRDRIRTCNLRLRRPTRYPIVPRGLVRPRSEVRSANLSTGRRGREFT